MLDAQIVTGSRVLADMDQPLESVPCLICGKDEAEVLFAGAGKRKIVRCHHDGLIYLNPRPTVEAIRTFHTSFVRPDNLPSFHEYRSSILQREAKAITQFKSRGNLLDIGCGTGTFFSNFTSDDWRLWGVDTAFLGVSMAQGEHGAEVFNGTLCEAHYPAKFFDVVTILDALYYNPDPKAELAEVRRILKDNGVLAVEVPGITHTFVRCRGPFAWLLDGKWTSGLTASNHLYYFSMRTLRLLLEAESFRVVKVIPEQASLSRGSVARAANEVHFALARMLFKLSVGRFSIAGKELYVAVKATNGPTGSKR
jgi:SAM-dependent methyltransferase